MENNSKKKIVISAVNLTNAGPFVILKECLTYLSENLSNSYNIIALVHDKSLLKIDNIEYYEFPDSKSSWFRRLYYEYVYFRKLSQRLKPYLWLSLHDITPNVKSEIRAVYCHNPGPFYKFSSKEILMDYKVIFFNLFYIYFYMFNIRKNNFVVVQQNWMRERFIKLYNVKNIIVSHPAIHDDFIAKKEIEHNRTNKKFIFFYPTFPRVFKNLEVICEATKILTEEGVDNFEIYLTIDGKENRYSRFIYNKYKSLNNIKYVGWLTREEVCDYYRNADCLVFPSKLETWGLPITEFKSFTKPILLADLEYAHEAIGDYDKVKFFDPNSAIQLSGLMNEIMENRLVFDGAKRKDIESPFVQSWKELFDILLSAKEPDKCTL